jgi:FdhD protein
MVHSSRRISASEITRIAKQFNQHSRKLGRVGSFQSAATFFGNKMEAFFEDVGLDNAVSKALGAIIKTGRDTSGAMLMSSGRQSASEVIKAARVGIPLIVSVRGPTYSGVWAAKKTGVTLCCFVTEASMRIYSGFERIVFGRKHSQLSR